MNGLQFKIFRKLSGKTQSEIGDLLKTHRNTIINWESKGVPLDRVNDVLLLMHNMNVQVQGVTDSLNITMDEKINHLEDMSIEDYKNYVRLLKKENYDLRKELEACKSESQRLKKHTDDVSQ